MKRLPRARLDIFRDAQGELARLAVTGLVELARNAAADIGEDEPQRASYGRVAFPSLPEHVVSGVDLELLYDGTVDDDHRRNGVGRGLHRQQVELRLADGFDRCEHDGKIVGSAAGHHSVDGDFLDRRQRHPGRDHADDGVRGLPDGRQHFVDALAARRHDGQAIGPALRVEIVVDLIRRRGLRRHRRNGVDRVVQAFLRGRQEIAHDVSKCVAASFPDFRLLQFSQRMGDHARPDVMRAERVCDFPSEFEKNIGHDGDSRDPSVFEFNRIMETP